MFNVCSVPPLKICAVHSALSRRELLSVGRLCRFELFVSFSEEKTVKGALGGMLGLPALRLVSSHLISCYLLCCYQALIGRGRGHLEGSLGGFVMVAAITTQCELRSAASLQR